MVEKIFDVVRNVSAQKIPILLVEQNARLALEAAHRAYVMDSGLITLSGKRAKCCTIRRCVRRIWVRRRRTVLHSIRRS